jgi:hypothetical protein
VVHALAEDGQITVVLPIIERTQFDTHHVPSLSQQTREVEERSQPSPGRLGKTLWKVVVSRPHHEIGHLRVLDGRFRKTVVRVQSKGQQEVLENILLGRAAGTLITVSFGGGNRNLAAQVADQRDL